MYKHIQITGFSDEINPAIDEQFALLGFTRSFLKPLPNLADATIYRITARYIATVDKNETIYRR